MAQHSMDWDGRSAAEYHCGRFLTFCDSHCSPSNRPSPVVAQLRTQIELRCDESKNNDRTRTWGGHTTSGPSSYVAPAFPLLLPATLLRAERGQRRKYAWIGETGRTSRKILLVCKDQQQTLLHLPIAQYAMQLLLCFV